MASALTWTLLFGYGLFVYVVVQKTTPRRVSASGFFQGESADGKTPRLWLLVSSAAISWIFAKSIDNAASLAYAFGIVGGVGYAIYYCSFITAAIAIYHLRVRGYTSLPSFLVDKYDPICAKLFLVAIAIRLFNEVWSNTKVFSLYFGAEGSLSYWMAAIVVTGFTVYYTLLGGLRSSLLTDGMQMLLAAVLLVAILTVLTPELLQEGFPNVEPQTQAAGMTFCGLALVQILSYPFHDPVLTDRAFITSPKKMVRGFVLAGLLSGGFILLFSIVGLYALRLGVEGQPTLTVPMLFGLPLLLVFNAIMLTSAGSTLDSTFSSTAKLSARDWFNRSGQPTELQAHTGRWAMIAIAILGNLPLLSIYLGDRIGPAIILATTISGTMVMGLAPIFLLSFIRSAGTLSFHLAFWSGLILGILRVIENAFQTEIFPAWMALGIGEYAIDLGINVYGLILCVIGYLLGALLNRKS
ncbi:Na+/proline symporter [Myxosarcina sp. GI1]|uniref:Na+/proline symporter n=1 Tax=Myxosarcina sp. GI1 TaxID=1541065 RepID=UPI000563942A|nr:Na+/proline symporter [Myxosarcina sp. GI1]